MLYHFIKAVNPFYNDDLEEEVLTPPYYCRMYLTHNLRMFYDLDSLSVLLCPEGHNAKRIFIKKRAFAY